MGSGGSKAKRKNTGSFDVVGQGTEKPEENQISTSTTGNENPEATPPTAEGGSGVTAAEQADSTTEQPSKEKQGDGQSGAMEKGEDYVEAVVAKASDFGDNE